MAGSSHQLEDCYCNSQLVKTERKLTVTTVRERGPVQIREGLTEATL